MPVFPVKERVGSLGIEYLGWVSNGATAQAGNLFRRGMVAPRNLSISGWLCFGRPILDVDA